MAMNGNPDRDVTQSDKVLDLHRDLPPRKGNENNSPEDICKSGRGPFLFSGDQSRSHDELVPWALRQQPKRRTTL